MKTVNSRYISSYDVIAASMLKRFLKIIYWRILTISLGILMIRAELRRKAQASESACQSLPAHVALSAGQPTDYQISGELCPPSFHQVSSSQCCGGDDAWSHIRPSALELAAGARYLLLLALHEPCRICGLQLRRIGVGKSSKRVGTDVTLVHAS